MHILHVFKMHLRLYGKSNQRKNFKNINFYLSDYRFNYSKIKRIVFLSWFQKRA